MTLFDDWTNRLWPSAFGERPPEGLVRWWRNQLTGCLPKPLRRLLGGPSERLVVEPGGQLAGIWLESENGRTELDPLDLQAPAPPDLSAAKRPDRLVVELRLPAGLALKKIVRLPVGVRENLRQVLGFEMDRLTPFRAEQVLYDCRLRNRDAQLQKLEVELMLVRRDRVEPWIRALTSFNLAPSTVTPADAWPGANLLPQDERGGSSRSGSRLVSVLWALLLLSIAAVMITPLIQKRVVLGSLGVELAQARRHANAVGDLRRELEQTRESALYVVEKRLKTTSVVGVLREVTRLLPDDTWAQQLELKGDRLTLRGESAQALGLIERLESSPMFEDVGFLSPVVQMRQQGRERFHLAARVMDRNSEIETGAPHDL